MMEIYENTNVLDEVELLFKKLEGLPDNAKQSVLSKIQEKVPGQDNNHNDQKNEGKEKCKVTREKGLNLNCDDSHDDQDNNHNDQKSEGKEKCKVTREKALNLNCDDSHDDQGVLTSRGRNTKNLNLHGESSKRSVENQVSLHESACSDEGDSLFIIQYPWMDHQYEAVAPQYISTPIGSSLKTCFERISDNSTHLNVDNTYDQTQVTGDQDEKKGRTKKSEPIPKKVDPSKTPYVCAECRKAFSSSYLLKVHMKNHRGEKDFQCDQCPFRTLTKTNLNQHMIVHKNVKDFMCEYCGKLFLRITGLQNHIQIHLGEKKHPCEECDYKTHSKASLQVHVLAKHNSENSNRHVCPVCGFVVKQQYQLVSHIRVHTGIRPYKCNVCAKTFVTNGILRRHVRHVHSSRQYNCDYCLKDFPTEFHLQRHIRIHFNDKPYNCPYCNYSSSTQGNVSKHVRSIHCKFDFSFRRLNAIKKLASSNGNELQWLEKSETVVKKYLERLSERNGSNLTLESLCEQERKRKSSDNVLLPKNKKHLKKASPVDHSYSEKAVRSDLQNTVQISPVSHDPLLTAHDNQLLSLDSSVAEMELTFHSDIPLQDYVMEMVNDLNPVEVMTAPLDVSLDQETLVVIIGQ